jgi:hypothetical protein
MKPMKQSTDTAWGDLDGWGSMAAVSSPGTMGANRGKLAGLLRKPRDWYRSFSEVFTASEENTIYPDVSSVGVLNADFSSIFNIAFAVEQHRYTLHRDLDYMDANDAIISTALDTIVDAALGREKGGVGGNKPIEIECKDPRVVQIIDDLCARVDVYHKIGPALRQTEKYGNSFWEMQIDDDYMTPTQAEDGGELMGAVTRLDPRPEHQMYPKLDEKGNERGGYTQKGRLQGKDTAIEYEDWQIIHFRTGEIVAGIGTPLFKSIMRTWKKLQYLEEGLVLARLTRAYPCTLHKVLIPVQRGNEAGYIQKELNQYKDRVEKKQIQNLDTGNMEATFNPISAAMSYYVPKLYSVAPGFTPIESEVEILEPSNTALGSFDDLLYHRDKIVCRSRVPRRYLGIEEKNPPQGDGLNREDVQFARILYAAQDILDQGLRKLFNYELMLHGILPHTVEYTIKFPVITTVDRVSEADLSLKAAQAMATWQDVFAGGLPTEFLVEWLKRSPDQDADELVVQIEEGKKKAADLAADAAAKEASAWQRPQEYGASQQPPPPTGGGPQFPTPSNQSFNRRHGIPRGARVLELRQGEGGKNGNGLLP